MTTPITIGWGAGIGKDRPCAAVAEDVMCGRYTITVSGRLLAELFDLDQEPRLAPRYNVAPTQQVPVVRLDPGGRQEWTEARWGLVPPWAKDPSVGARMVNARAETVADKPAFRSAVRRRRCLVPADGFYEWRPESGGKQPFLIRFTDGRPFAFAGLWELWRPPDGEPLLSCTIVTTSPNEVVAPLHDRMPVILPREHHREWLGFGQLGPDRLRQLLLPHPGEGMEAHPVSRRVNNPTFDDPSCAERTTV